MSDDTQVVDRPYDPTSRDYQPQTLPLDQLFELAMRKLELRLNVWRPATVLAVKGTGKVDLQIQLQAKYVTDDAPVTLPTIQDALVCQPRGAGYYIKLPVKVGDTGIALFCDRSLDSWSVQGGTVFPNDTRTHDLSDCVFIPGLYPFNNQIQDTTDDLIVKNGNAEMHIQSAGTFLIKNPQNEAFAVIDRLMANVDMLYQILTSETFTNTMLGPQPFIASTISALNDAKSDLESVKSDWETLKGSS